jgi:hypothetical protein
MEDVLTVSAFMGAALVGLAADSRVSSYLEERRLLRVAAFAAVFFLTAAIVAGR